MEQLEIIPRQHVDGMHVFINRVEYRSPHFHPEWELLWVLDTPLSITSGQKQHRIEPGEIILFPPNCPHEFHKMERPTTFLCLQISGRVFPSLAKYQTEDLKIRNYLSPEENLQLRRAMVDISRSCWGQQPFSEPFCLGLCGLVMHKILKRVPSHIMTAEESANMEQRNARLMWLMQFVDENYMHKIRLADFARQEGRTLSHMSHFVRQTMNQTFQEYVNSVRFNCARNLIASGSDSLTSICSQAGFSDYRYFSQAFQTHYGMTPAEYRLRAQTVPAEHMIPVQSLHSMETIYTPARSLEILSKFEEQI